MLVIKSIIVYRDMEFLLLPIPSSMNMVYGFVGNTLHSISNNIYDFSVYVLLQLIYWYCDVYNNRDISNDDYRSLI